MKLSYSAEDNVDWYNSLGGQLNSVYQNSNVYVFDLAI